ncbi:endo alpha-1,4 polygalactosaminidase [Rhodococcus aetherivorans]|uniref:endo alpha-1,4 polygalactosaminidase n=1 Tax=Rhodococcus aetherivorans TaxID=191292 RepID=UPI003676CD9B
MNGCHLRIVLLSSALVAGALSACTPVEEPPNSEIDIELPPTHGKFDYQLGGAYLPPEGVTVVARDSTDEPVPNTYSICYVNGFQTQPDEASIWIDSNEDLLLHEDTGEHVVDPDWPDEYILNPTTESNRTRIVDIVGAVIDRCAEAGFDAVEIDNLDTWTRFTDVLDQDSSLALAAMYAERAHQLGLAVAQKNAAEAAEEAKNEANFDFVVAESCIFYGECGRYLNAYGPHVLDIEYSDTLDTPFSDVCRNPHRPPTVILRDRNLEPDSASGYVYETC